MVPRGLHAIMSDVLKTGRCSEVSVEYSCSHTCEADVHIAPFLQDKSEPRALARALRSGCRRGQLPLGDAGVFRIDVLARPCSACGCRARSSLWCGGTAMDLTKTDQATDEVIPVGIGAQQFLQWLEMEPVEENSSLKVPLMVDPQCGGQSWYAFFTTPGSLGPIMLGIMMWVTGSFFYAAHAAQNAIMLPPKIFIIKCRSFSEPSHYPSTAPIIPTTADITWTSTRSTCGVMRRRLLRASEKGHHPLVGRCSFTALALARPFLLSYSRSMSTNMGLCLFSWRCVRKNGPHLACRIRPAQNQQILDVLQKLLKTRLVLARVLH